MAVLGHHLPGRLEDLRALEETIATDAAANIELMVDAGWPVDVASLAYRAWIVDLVAAAADLGACEWIAQR